ncbi:MAG TPA: anthranilate synthase component I, partial [Actinobacteria bacterium]|nr:anthranilate synthase component I [Actinomycetota bacterium]
MQTPFDIAADLHTPVSAYLRLEPLAPRYLLESVEGGHQGRYSFIGFGETLRIAIEPQGVRVGGELVSKEPLDGLRTALGRAPQCGPFMSDQPFSGGLVGVAAFDLVRRFYPLPQAPHRSTHPEGAYM